MSDQDNFTTGHRPSRGDDPAEVAKEFAEAANAEGFNFDLTLNSLQTEVDKYLEKYFGNTDKDHEALLTAYIGETIRYFYDGEWEGEYYKNKPGINYYTTAVRIGKYVFHPSHFIAYYFSNGKGPTGTFGNYLLGKNGLLSRIDKES